MSTTTRRRTKPAATLISQPRRPETVKDSWENRTACYNRPQEWWDGEDPKLTKKARAVCLSCPVLAECLSDQMERETDQMWTRTSIRGGTTGLERVQLCIDAESSGPYDAEEARLLALEAGAYGKPVADVAETAITRSTLRLAARMAGEYVEPVQPVRPVAGTALEKAFQHATQIMQWSSEGVSRRAMAERLAVGRSAVDVVVRTYRELTGETEREKEIASEDVDKELIGAYLRGDWVKVTDEQRLAAIAEGVLRGMSYLDIDRVQSQAPNTTAQFVSRTRKRYGRAGQPFPAALSKSNRLTLTNEQVIEIREAYAVGDVRDMDLAVKYGVSRNVISHLVSGRNYKHVGGPIRQGKSAASKAASKAMNDQVCALAFAAGRANRKMGEAA